MLLEEVGNLWDNVHPRLEANGTEITLVVFKNELLEKYFPEDVCGKKEIEFLELKKGNMIVAEYAAKFEALVKFEFLVEILVLVDYELHVQLHSEQINYSVQKLHQLNMLGQFVVVVV